MFQLLTLIFLLIISYVFWKVYINQKHEKTKVNLPPGSFGWPFIGESLAYLRAGSDGVPERFIKERIEKHGSHLVFKTSLLGDRMAVLCGPAGNKFLFGNENKLVGLWWPESIRKLFGRCLITIRGDEAKWMRKMLLSYLGPDAFVNHYAATMDTVTRRHIDCHWRGMEEVNVYQTVKVYAFELACRLFMSLEDPNHIAKLGSLFNIFLKGMVELPLDFPGTRFFKSKRAAAAIRTELMTLIKTRRVELQEGKTSSSQDMLSHFLCSPDENNKYLTETEIANNILLLLFAGHDTSTISITLVMKKLSEHPDVYDKVLRGMEEVNVYQTVKVYAFELACRLFMSLEDPNHIAKLGSLFNIFLKGMVELPLDFPGTRFFKSKRAAAAIRTELMTLIKTRRVELQEGKTSSSQDMLSHFLCSPDENNKYLTETEIANNILLLLFAGHDTSTISITLVMKKLSEHPDVYDKVLREQLEISKAKEAGGLLQWEDIQKMKYTWNVVSEVMRLNPPALGAFREALVDFEYAGYVIPKGWKLYWSAIWTHKDEANFEDVTRFDPSRFEGAGPAPYTYVPFGGGPRMCLGKEFSRMEVLAFLHNIVTVFKWDLLIPNEKIVYDPMARPANGLPVRLNPHRV